MPVLLSQNPIESYSGISEAATATIQEAFLDQNQEVFPQVGQLQINMYFCIEREYDVSAQLSSAALLLKSSEYPKSTMPLIQFLVAEIEPELLECVLSPLANATLSLLTVVINACQKLCGPIGLGSYICHGVGIAICVCIACTYCFLRQGSLHGHWLIDWSSERPIISPMTPDKGCCR